MRLLSLPVASLIATLMLPACQPASPPPVAEAPVAAAEQVQPGQSPVNAASVVAPDLATNPVANPTAAIASYKLGSGDILRIRVFDEENLSGEFEVDGNGEVSMPLIGTVEAKGLTSRTFEDRLEAKLRQGYLIDPQVSVEVMNYRPFYILGEVKQPGSYPYVNGMTVLNAVALAGGYTYRARTSTVNVRRATDDDGKQIEAQPSASIFPGDVITVEERYF